MFSRNQALRAGFTLVEILVVISIIGVLVGITVPAVMMAMNAVKRAAIAMETQTLSNAVEQYKTKFGDYPPDGSNKSVFERSLRKAFPQIAASEFAAVYASANWSTTAPSGVMDPGEALVFFLGGFSDNPTNPITGPGGPLIKVGAVYQYNVDRNKPFFEFNQAQLTLDDTTGLSTDEGILSLGATPDSMPVYHPSGRLAPYVYFDSRTYTIAAGTAKFYNHFTSSAIAGAARPYRSDKVNPAVALASNPDAHYRFVDDKKFQIISAGLDDGYGGIVFTSGSGPVYYRYPTGESLDFGSNPPTAGGSTRYKDTDPANYQLDNTTSFSDGVLEDALPN